MAFSKISTDTIKGKIQRLAELNASFQITRMNDNHRIERNHLHARLIEIGITKVTNPEKSGKLFHFVGVGAVENAEIYNESYRNF